MTEVVEDFELSRLQLCDLLLKLYPFLSSRVMKGRFKRITNKIKADQNYKPDESSPQKQASENTEMESATEDNLEGNIPSPPIFSL